MADIRQGQFCFGGPNCVVQIDESCWSLIGHGLKNSADKKICYESVKDIHYQFRHGMLDKMEDIRVRRVVQTEDLSNVEFETSEDVEVIPTFDSMSLREELLRGIYAYGFEKPSAIQQRSIKPIIKGRDVIAQAQSGTGKTATFSISILQSLDTTVRESQVLCLSPTRELATQIQKVILALGDFMNVQCHACIGGTNLGEDIRKLDYGQHVVSGTPGRVF
ncbi:hypothetical protein L9F63_016962, partial [Diploptera punctata]